MEELTEIFEAELEVSTVPNDPVRKHPRFALYKAHNKKSDQEERRRMLLEEQKKKRSELFDASRGLAATVEESDDSDAMDCSTYKAPKIPRMYVGKLMLSEWLVDVPEDLEQEWYMVPCPEGHRAIVVARKDRTMSFTKAGIMTASFKSLLPGGSQASERGCTKLDCIWSPKDRTYYVLDVLSWGRQSFMYCETEFRFYWLRTQLQDVHKRGISCKENAYAFKKLPHYKCTKDTMTEVMADENMFSKDGPRLDGLLFYHSRTHYMSGYTPLVGWLKPYMITEMLGVQVAALYQQEYTDCKKKERNIQHIRNKKKAEAEPKMDTSNPEECDTTDPGMVVCGAD